MRSSLALTALCAATALGAAVEKRSYKTEVVVVTVTETVHPGSEPTVVPEPEPPVNKHNPGQNNSPPPPPPQEQNPPQEDKPIIGDKPGNQNPKPDHPKPTPQEPEQPEQTYTQQPDPQTTTQQSSPETTQYNPQPTQEPDPQPQPPASGYKGTILEHHNMHRTNHSATPIQWDENLVDSARQLAKSCVYGHNTDYNGGGYGQNIGYGIGAQDVGMMITNLMYNEEFGYFEDLFGQASPSMSGFDKWGHFTQILWKDTTHVGCITVPCESLQNVDTSPSEPIPYTVCNYSPPGNYAGSYAENVGKPLGQKQRIAQ